MGGGAFAQAAARGEPTLNTPRMSPNEYASLKINYLARIQGYFPNAKVACLTEAPGKEDYGDIDMFIAVDQRVDFIEMANHLGVAGVICNSSGKVQKCSIAVPKNGTKSSRPAVVYKMVQQNNDRKTKPSTAVTTEEYAQIDVEVVSPELLEWFVFYSSYGDMAALLGHIVHSLGFRVSDLGLSLRMKELDLSKTVQYANIADKEGLIFLSKDPSHVMQFLGLSVEGYDAGFQTLEQLYEWLGLCRLLSAEAVKTKRDNAHERNREQKRVVFCRFFFEWLPKHMDLDADQDKQEKVEKLQQLRKQYLEEAVDFFSKREEYNVKHDALVLKMNNATAANLLRPLIAQHSNKDDKLVSEILRAFRRYVVFESDGAPHVHPTPHSDAESQLGRFLDEDGVLLKSPQTTADWVGMHWEELRTLERERAKLSTGERE